MKTLSQDCPDGRPNGGPHHQSEQYPPKLLSWTGVFRGGLIVLMSCFAVILLGACDDSDEYDQFADADDDEAATVVS